MAGYTFHKPCSIPKFPIYSSKLTVMEIDKGDGNAGHRKVSYTVLCHRLFSRQRCLTQDFKTELWPGHILIISFHSAEKNQIFCLIQATRRRPGKFSFRYCFFTEDILASRSRKTTSVNNKMNDSCFTFMVLVLCMLAHCHDLLGCPDGTEFEGKSLINMFFP